MAPIVENSRTRETRASRGARGVTRRAGVAFAGRAPIPPASDPPALTLECARAPRGTSPARRSALPMAPANPSEEKSRTRETRASRGARAIACRIGARIAAATPISPASDPLALTPERARAPRGTPSIVGKTSPKARFRLSWTTRASRSRNRSPRASRFGPRSVGHTRAVFVEAQPNDRASNPPALTPECVHDSRGTP